MHQSFYEIVQDDLRAVNRLSLERLTSNIPLVEEVGAYLVQAGGKRLRPLLVLLAARSLGYEGDRHVKLATVIEFLHTAMLLHDDVVDSSEMRRGRATVNSAWGNSTSVLVGDFLHSRAFEMMVELGNMEVMQILSHATNTITEGEVQQLAHVGDLHLSEQTYMDIIYRKTAKLFEACSQSAAVLVGADGNTARTLSDYGSNLGMAFQLVDDALDYVGESKTLGKKAGKDLAEGKFTLPLIFAFRKGGPEEVEPRRLEIQKSGNCNLHEIAAWVADSGAIQYTFGQANRKKELAVAALESMAPSPYREAMHDLASFVVDRNH